MARTLEDILAAIIGQHVLEVAKLVAERDQARDTEQALRERIRALEAVAAADAPPGARLVS